jgi:excisionase family DNA binding protein
MSPIPPDEQSPYGGGAPFNQFAYSIEDTARLASVGRTALYAEIKAGRLSARKVGRRTIILDRDLRAWLEAAPALHQVAQL